MKTKALLLFYVLLASAYSLRAQEFDLKEYFSRWEDDLPNVKIQDGLYIKDISGVLNPFLGTWAGTYGDYGYILSIHKGITYGKRVKTSRDNLMVQYKLFKNNGLGRWWCVRTVKQYQGQQYVMFGRKWFKSGSYGFLYIGNTPEQVGKIVLRPEQGKLKLYLMDDVNYRWLKGPQEFPHWDGEKGMDNVTYLTKISDEQYLFEDSQIIPDPRWKVYPSDPIYQFMPMIVSAYLGGVTDTYVPLLNPSLISKFCYTIALQGGSMDSNIQGFADINYDLAFRSGMYYDSYILRYNTEVLNKVLQDSTLSFAVNFKLLLQGAMMEHLIKLTPQKEIDRDMMKSYGSDFYFLLQVYSKARGITVEELKKRCIEDALKIYRARKLRGEQILYKYLTEIINDIPPYEEN